MSERPFASSTPVAFPTVRICGQIPSCCTLVCSVAGIERALAPRTSLECLRSSVSNHYPELVPTLVLDNLVSKMDRPRFHRPAVDCFYLVTNTYDGGCFGRYSHLLLQTTGGPSHCGDRVSCSPARAHHHPDQTSAIQRTPSGCLTPPSFSTSLPQTPLLMNADHPNAFKNC